MTLRTWLENAEDLVLSVIEDRRKGRAAALLRALLGFLSFLFTVVQLRLWLFRNGIIRPYTLGCQVISIGNLTVGGTGKTPIVEVFARHLQKSGRRVAILSRGYKKKEDPFLTRLLNTLLLRRESEPPRVVSDGKRLLLDSAQSGDEPYMLATNLPDVVVIVDKDRVKAGRHAVRKFGCDTLILDDGFQYLRLRHRLDIVLVDRTNPFGNQRLLPRGILREPTRNIRRAGFIFITKSPAGGAPELKDQLRRLNPIAEIVECRHSPKHVQNVYTGETHPLEFLKGKTCGAVSAIASPQGFEETLVKLGATLRYHKRYADHHRYSQQEILDVINRASEKGCEMIVTTEKDAVRFPMLERRDLPVYFLRVEIEMLTGEEQFHDWIDRICFK